jgi:hypothetical protein
MVNMIIVWRNDGSWMGFWLWVRTRLGVIDVRGGRGTDRLIAESVVGDVSISRTKDGKSKWGPVEYLEKYPHSGSWLWRRSE